MDDLKAPIYGNLHMGYLMVILKCTKHFQTFSDTNYGPVFAQNCGTSRDSVPTMPLGVNTARLRGECWIGVLLCIEILCWGFTGLKQKKMAE